MLLWRTLVVFVLSRELLFLPLLWFLQSPVLLTKLFPVWIFHKNEKKSTNFPHYALEKVVLNPSGNKLMARRANFPLGTVGTSICVLPLQTTTIFDDNVWTSENFIFCVVRATIATTCTRLRTATRLYRESPLFSFFIISHDLISRPSSINFCIEFLLSESKSLRRRQSYGWSFDRLWSTVRCAEITRYHWNSMLAVCSFIFTDKPQWRLTRFRFLVRIGNFSQMIMFY